MFGTTQSRNVVHRLNEKGYEAVFVGGAVRDFLLGKEPKDIDIATAATPDQVKTVFKNTIDLGTEHGTVLVIEGGEPIEVTTYRTEGTYSDHRRPDEVQFVTSLKEDLMRRDFTINSLALTLEGHVIDPFEGKKDLAEKTIRAVGYASERFSEDALRMIRAIRFVSVLDFNLECMTKDAITKLGNTVETLSTERIKKEFDKLFKGIASSRALKLMTETNLSSFVPLFPSDIESFIKCAPFQNELEGWCSLMIAGNYDASTVAKAYKLSNKERGFLQDVKLYYEIRKSRSYTIDDYYKADFAVLKIVEKLIGVLTDLEPLDESAISLSIEALPILSKHELAIRGEHLMKWTDKKPGRWIGEAITAIEQAVLHKRILNEQNAIKEWFSNEYKHKK
ncbi:CCA tRNA nucleotidyltransferase [Sporosarcina aquimarina]|uniref:CCA tRNA nucleotidyltransferase n=1 Tax=Sporosarcina aquimarina TaxID=114975 RepID=A0ABU4FY97_9BACL|nr:CCA tRNA nucleotidyltransferase [Sporosarcina aquimarina]MDW0109060.1 CCA tRNA nucleotidyltransferase [Sporosarcina aquimarina]